MTTGEDGGKRWVQAGTTGPPLVAVHSWVAEAANYQRLSDVLGGRRIYSLLAPDPAGERLPRRVSGWVDHHEATLESIGLAPPWRFVGVVVRRHFGRRVGPTATRPG